LNIRQKLPYFRTGRRFFRTVLQRRLNQCADPVPVTMKFQLFCYCVYDNKSALLQLAHRFRKPEIQVREIEAIAGILHRNPEKAGGLFFNPHLDLLLRLRTPAMDHGVHQQFAQDNNGIPCIPVAVSAEKSAAGFERFAGMAGRGRQTELQCPAVFFPEFHGNKPSLFRPGSRGTYRKKSAQIVPESTHDAEPNL
jgi:hypothetical protein